jgi:hypothetical protein
MANFKFKAIIQSPDGKTLNEELVITQENIDEYLNEGTGTQEEAIDYFKSDYIAEWEQRFHKCILYSVNSTCVPVTESSSKILCILDYNCHQNRVFNYPEGRSEQSEDVEEYIEELGINSSNVDWMLTDNEVSFE